MFGTLFSSGLRHLHRKGGGVDICVVSSGRDVESLRGRCEALGWSYLSTDRNNVCLAQNIAIDLHTAAKMIYKLDEDIFVTEGTFEKLMRAYHAAPERLNMEVGFVAPLIPLNGYGYVKVLKRLGLAKEWGRRFGALFHTEGLFLHTAVYKEPEAALFMWGAYHEKLRDIDALNALFQRESGKNGELDLSICPHRFNIGAILFARPTWESMGMFPVERTGTGMGRDETALCAWCMLHTRAIVISEDCVVGHLGYSPQTKTMLEYYKSHIGQFDIGD